MTENRRKPRKDCRIPASIRAGENECRAYVVDFNEFGVRLLIENGGKTISEDDEVEIHTQEFGLLKGKARWRTSHRVGVELQGGAKSLARLSPQVASDSPAHLQLTKTADDRKIADELARAAARPDAFTKTEMAYLMKQAAEKMRRDESMLTRIKGMLTALSAMGHDDPLRSANATGSERSH